MRNNISIMKTEKQNIQKHTKTYKNIQKQKNSYSNTECLLLTN